MTECAQTRVESVVWPGRDAALTAVSACPKNVLRGVIVRALLLYLVAAIAYRGLGLGRVGIALAVAGTAMVVLGMAWRRGYAVLDRFAMAFGRGIGQVLTWVLLTPLYWLFFAVIGNFARLFGKDPLCRKFDACAKTYWIDRTLDAKPKDYKRQF